MAAAVAGHRVAVIALLGERGLQELIAAALGGARRAAAIPAGRVAVIALLGEQCDDGNTMSGDGCSAACVNERCGDGLSLIHISEPTRQAEISYAVFCLKK